MNILKQLIQLLVGLRKDNLKNEGQYIMIMKFDHVSYIAQRQDIDKVLGRFGQGFKLYFKETDKENLCQKQNLMHDKQEKHDLYFYNGRLPIEIIAYEMTYEGEQLDVNIEERIFYAKSNDMPTCVNILRCLGINEVIEEGSGLKCNLRGALDREDLWLNIVLEKNIKPAYLDDMGFGCITFWVDSMEKVQKGLRNVDGVDTLTSPEVIVVNSRKLEVSFLRLKCLNIIFELIVPVKRANQ